MMEKKKVIALAAVAAVAASLWLFNLNLNNNSLAASGVIEATEVTLSSKTVGKVLEVKVEEGSAVSSGETLALIDPRETEARLVSSNAKYKIAADNFKRSRQLYAENLISEQQFEAAKSNYLIAQSAVRIAKLNLENSFINAPFSGIILTRAVEEGELAVVGQPIMTMADLSFVTLKVYLAEKEVGQAALGQKVKVTVDSYPDKTFTGRVVYISDKAEFTPKSIQTKDERTTLVFGVKIKIPNPGLLLKPGMPADAEFAWPAR